MQRTLVGLVRDLRGIAFAFNAKTSFMMLFEWMYPSVVLKLESSRLSEGRTLADCIQMACFPCEILTGVSLHFYSTRCPVSEP